MLFNPRQLLSLAKLSKLVAEIAEELTSKKWGVWSGGSPLPSFCCLIKWLIIIL